MAVYKVPQDVEADDKLIGPFSFRQFIYLIIVAISIALGWGLWQLFPPLAVVVLPIVLLFGALALPLRKDQPMEVYLAALVSFYLKPRRRLWQADGIQSLVEITAPKTVEIQRTNNLSQIEAQQRLSYLANLVDTGGWSVRGVAMPEAPSAMRSDVYFEAQQTQDILDDDGGVSRSFDSMITQSDAKRRQDAMDLMRQPQTQEQQSPTPATATPYDIPDPYTVLSSAPAAAMSAPTDPRFNFNPYPNAMRQSVVSPIGEQPAPQQAAQPTVQPQPQQLIQQQPQPQVVQAAPLQQAAPTPTISEKAPSPDIINLANNPDLSIQTIAHEANRINKRQQAINDEVVISLR